MRTAAQPGSRRCTKWIYRGKPKLTPVFTDNVTATNLVIGGKVALNLTDPDSSGAVPRTVPGVGEGLMLVGQADKQLVFVRHPSARDLNASCCR
jgi:hypothetical protein